MPPAIAAIAGLALSAAQAKAAADRQKAQSEANAEGMRNSSWTKLGSNFQQAENQNRQYNAPAEGAKNIAGALSAYQSQTAADANTQKQDDMNARWMKLMESRSNPQIGALEQMKPVGQALPNMSMYTRV